MALAPRIAVIEDEEALSILLRYNLEAEGYQVVTVANGDEAEIVIRDNVPDLAILDWMLPGVSGIELCRRFRAWPETRQMPIIMLTARGEESERVRGLATGADDYVVKPFSTPELMARVKAMLRRRERPQAAGVQQFSLGSARVDLAAFTVERDGVVHTLSPKEAGMLSLLRQHGGRAVSRAKFLSDVWGGDQFVGDRTIDTHMLNLRQKVELDPKQPRFLLTVHGVGYRLVEGPERQS